MTELERVLTLANLLVSQKETVESLEEALKTAKANALRLEREDLPDLMSECGLKSFTMEDGSVVSVKQEVDAAITEATRQDALRWLVDNGFSGLIKTSVAVQFDRGSQEEAVELAAELRKQYGDAELKELVHPATLKSFVKEQLEDGAAIPLDFFNVRPYNVAKITKARK